MSEPIRVVATLRCKPGTGGQAVAAARACVMETRREAGCRDYAAYRTEDDSDRIIFVELWDDLAALGVHRTTPHLKALVQAVSGLAAAPLEVLVLRDIG